jgi:hypothetical protein
VGRLSKRPVKPAQTILVLRSVFVNLENTVDLKKAIHEQKVDGARLVLWRQKIRKINEVKMMSEG